MNTPFEFKPDNRTSTAYLGTVTHKSRAGKLIVEALRREWKRRSEIDGKNYRVVLKGRLGKDNENAFKYSKNCSRPWTWAHQVFGAHSHQTIKLADAAFADMYVYERY